MSLGSNPSSYSEVLGYLAVSYIWSRMLARDMGYALAGAYLGPVDASIFKILFAINQFTVANL